MPIVARAVTFDLWHTLLYLEPEAEDTYNQRQRELGEAALADSPVGGTGSLSEIDAFRTVSFEALRMSEQGESISPAAQITRAGTLSGRLVDPERYVARLEALVASSPFRVAPGALGAMAEIAARRVRIGVIANTVGEPGRALQRICEREGFGKFVTGWSWSDELPWTKPSPNIFLHCLQQLGSAPSSAVHVGDGAWDIDGSRRAGYRASVLYTGLARYGAYYRTFVMRRDPVLSHPDHIVPRLGLLPALVEDIWASHRPQP